MSTKNAVFVKDPQSIIDYVFSWVDFLAVAENVIASSWIAPAGITVVSDAIIGGNKTQAFFSGGVAGQNYPITNRISTDQFRTEDVTLFLQVRESTGAGTSALLTLPELKGFLGPGSPYVDGSYDVTLLNNIESVSKDAERICGRKFHADDYTERVTYEGRGDIELLQGPIQKVFSVHTNLQSAIDVKNAAANAVRAFVRMDEDRVLSLQVVGGASSGTLTIDTNSGYEDTLQDVVDAINVIGSGWSASLATGRTGFEPSEDFMETISVRVVPNSGQSSSIPMLGEPVDAAWSIDREGSFILRGFEIVSGFWETRFDDPVWATLEVDLFFDRTIVNTSRIAWVKYRAGYDVIEKDLKKIIANQVRREMQADAYNPFLSSERIGGYSYSNASLSGVAGTKGTLASVTAQDFELALARWRRIHV